MPVFIGLDLAWTPHHETGVCMVEGDERAVRLTQLDCRVETPDGFARLCDAGDNVVAAIDAPLVVDRERRAERELNVAFGRYRASAFSANLPFLARMNGLAGPELAIRLAGRGFALGPSRLARQATGRFAIEVFPHPAHVVLFELAERIAYKKGRLAARRNGLRCYQQHLAALLEREMPGLLVAPEIGWVLDAAALSVTGPGVKRIEDQLDAVTCVYMAYHCWKHGPDGFRVFGSDEHGTIVTPVLVR